MDGMPPIDPIRCHPAPVRRKRTRSKAPESKSGVARSWVFCDHGTEGWWRRDPV